MSMLDRRSRSRSPRTPARRGPAPEGPGQAVPTSTGPDEETVRLVVTDFRRRRRAGRRRTLLLVLSGVMLLGLVAGAVWAVMFSSLLSVQRAQVVGNTEVPTARIDRAAAVPVGRPLARVDLDAVRARVESIAGVRSATVSRGWPHDVRVAVTERTPVAVLDDGSGLASLDATGAVFGRVEQRPRGLPLVQLAPGARAEALAEGAEVVASLTPEVARKVTTVQVASVDEISLLLGNGRRVVWGSAEASREKAEVLAVLLRRPGQVLDVSVPGRPTTR